ncbi:MAG: N-acetyltransferase [Deferribacteraceae bacterium]|jgi:amino-acid N-acetyltransferase|nr:N-acetyltransferase [Deferribacteraceae bacterium]
MIRAATIKDAKSIQTVVNAFATKGQMLVLSVNDVYEKIFEYFVYEVDGAIVGVCALHPTWEDIAEIRSLAVNSNYQKHGIGRQLVASQLDRAREMGFEKVFTLTYQEEFFSKLGFGVVTKDVLPKKMWTDCLKCVKYPDCDEIAMLRSI